MNYKKRKENILNKGKKDINSNQNLILHPYKQIKDLRRMK